MAASGSTSSGVSFPSFDPPSRNVQPIAHMRPPHLPFRRISLPTAPTLMHRESIVSVASFDSLPEEGDAPLPTVPAIMRITHSPRKNKARPPSVESPRKAHRRRDTGVRHNDEARTSKRRKIIEEFYETERAYVDGLELVYSHFLTPIIASLDTPNPLLARSVLTSVFSNFIDIWNLHRSFFSSLTTLVSKYGIAASASTSTSSLHLHDTPPLSPILLAHFPYLSLYNPFVTSFPSTISSLSNLISPPSANRPNPHYSPAFASFLATREADPVCGKLKLRDWLLTIVQRCPRYLLLLKDLINSTLPEDPEHAQLMAVHTLVSKITLSLNTSLHTHAQTLALLALQRSTPNLPFQLIAPGRTLLKRGPLIHVERSTQPREHEFLLFSDTLLWLSSEDTDRAWKSDWGLGRTGWGGAGFGSSNANLNLNANGNGGDSSMSASSSPQGRPPMMRSRSKSEAELSSMLRTRVDATEDSDDTTPSPSGVPSSGSGVKLASKPGLPAPRSSYLHPPSSNMIKRQASAGGEERWVYKGRLELVDLEVIVTPIRELGEERRFEVLSPEGSFVLYASSEEEKDDWSSAIRQAKAQLLVSLNVTHPNSTLTSSESTNHLRRRLQALPFAPDDGTLAALKEGPDGKMGKGKWKGKKGGEGEENGKGERRGKVEHWVPAIWIPDEKTEGCMRCGRTFGWRRRRHHCRLCGRCVCAVCSGRTFFISDSSSKDKSSKPARACNTCYETVFPLLDAPSSSSQPLKADADTITSLNHFPSWLSMPSLPVNPTPPHTPQALMAISSELPSRSNTSMTLAALDERYERSNNIDIGEHADHAAVGEKRGRVRLKEHSRPRSYHQILEDFEYQEQNSGVSNTVEEDEDEEDVYEAGENNTDILGPVHKASPASSRMRMDNTSPSPSPRKEDTARRHKRFSLPAVAIQTTSVTARTNQSGFEGDASGGSPSSGGGAVKNKRFSLVLGGRSSHSAAGVRAQSEENSPGKGELSRGLAAGKLSELLGRKKS